MRTVTDEFTTESGNQRRKPLYKVEIDWNLTGNYIDESWYLLSLGVERSIEEPLGGVNSCLADVVLANQTNRFTPS